MADEKYRLYLYDLGYLIREYAEDAKKRRDGEADPIRRAIYAGELLAYHGVVSLMQQQARGFDIHLDELRLADVIPDRDLT